MVFTIEWKMDLVQSVSSDRRLSLRKLIFTGKEYKCDLEELKDSFDIDLLFEKK